MTLSVGETTPRSEPIAGMPSPSPASARARLGRSYSANDVPSPGPARRPSLSQAPVAPFCPSPDIQLAAQIRRERPNSPALRPAEAPSPQAFCATPELRTPQQRFEQVQVQARAMRLAKIAVVCTAADAGGVYLGGRALLAVPALMGAPAVAAVGVSALVGLYLQRIASGHELAGSMGPSAWAAMAGGAALVGVATALWPATMGIVAAPILGALLVAGAPALLGNVVPTLFMALAPLPAQQRVGSFLDAAAASVWPRVVAAGLVVGCVATGPFAAGAGVFGVALGISVMHAQSVVRRAHELRDYEEPKAPYARRGVWGAAYLMHPATLGLAATCLPVVAPAAAGKCATEASRTAAVAAMAFFAVYWATLRQSLPLCGPASEANS